MFIVHPAFKSRAHHEIIVLPSGGGFGSLRHLILPWRCYAALFWGMLCTQSGAQRFAFVALLLLALPDVFTFHALLALPRFAERNRQF
jgi:hypothetical protein